MMYAPFGVAVLAAVTYLVQARFRARGQAVTVMVMLLAAAKFLFFETFGGDAFNPELPAPVLWGFNGLYSSVFVLLPLSLLTLPLRGWRARRWLLPVLAAVVAGWGIFCGLRTPSVVYLDLVYPDLPPELDGYRILQLSDLHISASARQARTRAIVERANAEGADLICVTGDIADGIAARHREDVAPLAELRAKDGVWFVTGNHEFYQDSSAWQALYRSLGLRFLDGSCVRPRPGLALAGLSADPQAGGNYDPEEVRKLYAQSDPGDFRVLLLHFPQWAAKYVGKAGVRLQLSGHTHGGIMPFADRLVAACNGGYVHGAYALDGGCLYVSRGSGQWAGFPMRLLNPSEITVLTLKRRETCEAK